jgi:hypothetical protein
MGDIEFAAYHLYGVRDDEIGPVSAPLIDWSWYTASPRVVGGAFKGDPAVPERWPLRATSRRSAYMYPHVMFPHIITITVGVVLFVIGLFGGFGPI